MAVNVNLAYDLEKYEQFNEQEDEYAARIRSKRSANKRRRNAANVKIILGAMIVLALLSGILYGKAELSRLYAENTNLENELAVLNNENLSLQSELAQQTGLTKVEEYAEKNLGLQKLDKSQIEYVEIQEKTTAERVQPEDTNIFIRLSEWWEETLEYLGL
ncbi:cell division protein FtsL [Ruminococcus sp. YE71]|uniref:cell division protein FtsL n=1 Tax=unclassified Ruminococcus TaxID=2608920 RepID=UPI00088C368B|nr:MULTISPECIES: cell division protein FtsL [unclassified Ruminococcus]SDA11892.1 cell division protein FtsL [Ruminococcus sp. YE78]SFW15917.1 cell division protein FtsL [Ruminococcus sp. YE71]